MKKSSSLDHFKMEVANELGIGNYDQIDKGQFLPVQTAMLAAT
jgi:hypothetical protein